MGAIEVRWSMRAEAEEIYSAGLSLHLFPALATTSECATIHTDTLWLWGKSALSLNLIALSAGFFPGIASMAVSPFAITSRSNASPFTFPIMPHIHPWMIPPLAHSHVFRVQ
jgi:hypothetical protein